jgi:hypothetical protein
MRPVVYLLTLLLSIGYVLGQTTIPSAVPTGSKDRKPHPATQPGQVLEMSIAELGNFDFDEDTKGAVIPADVKAMSGVTVRLKGYMVPIGQAKNITKFALVQELFGDHNPSLLTQTIIVNCPATKPVQYDPNKVVVEGKLKVGVVKDDGFVVCLLALDNASVKPAPR